MPTRRVPTRLHALAYCRDFFTWHKHCHRHVGIAMLAPEVVHHGRADAALDARQRVLDRAYAAKPDRFVNGAPTVARLPREVWINPPEDKTQSVIELQEISSPGDSNSPTGSVGCTRNTASYF